MTRAICTLLLCSPFNIPAAQSIQNFELKPPPFKVAASYYQNIGFLDSRHDTSMIGIVSAGFTRKGDDEIRLPSSFLPQLTRFVAAVTSGSGQGSLLFQLRKFRFVEESGTRYCYLDATLYARYGERYKRLVTMDTVLLLDGSDPYYSLDREGNRALSRFLTGGVSLLPADSSAYDLYDVMHIDSIEKAGMPLYNSETLTDGIYTQYASFRQQVPDWKAAVRTRKDGTIVSLKALGSGGKPYPVDPANLYALVYEGHPYIVTQYGFYPLQKLMGEFYCTADVSVSYGSVRGGGSRGTYYLMVDHRNGELVHLKAIARSDNGN